jgi:hypothetical protein
MKTLHLKRIIQSNDLTLGTLSSQEVLYALVLELPWKDNVPFESCIPAGTYRCELVSSPKYGKVYEVKGVLGRSNILIHYGNYVRNTDGCLLVGDSLMRDVESGLQAVGNSKRTLESFMTELQGESFDLVIRWGGDWDSDGDIYDNIFDDLPL